MARLTFSNVPTASGGVISGNISTGAGSPFGAGGKYEAQVSDIKATIAKAPKGFYDPVGWDDFLRKEELYSEQLPEGVRFYGADDPEIMEELLKIPSAREALYGLGDLKWTLAKYGDTRRQATINADLVQSKIWEKEIALHVNRLLMEFNAPLIKAVEEHESQLEIDQAVKLALEQIALEQKVRETSKPTPEAPATPISTISILPIIFVAVALIGVLLFLKRRA